MRYRSDIRTEVAGNQTSQILTPVQLRRDGGGKDLGSFLFRWRCYVLICRSSIAGSTGVYVAGTSAAYENQASRIHFIRQGNVLQTSSQFNLPNQPKLRLYYVLTLYRCSLQ